MKKRLVLVALLTLGAAGCSGDDNSVDAHCFDQQKRLTLPSFVSTTCPTIADTVTNQPRPAPVTP
jgi:hypothetical protein